MNQIMTQIVKQKLKPTIYLLNLHVKSFSKINILFNKEGLIWAMMWSTL